MKPIKKSKILWLYRDKGSDFTKASLDEPIVYPALGRFYAEDYVDVPCFLGQLGLRPGTRRRVKVTVIVEDAR